jgi:Xaa-Pro aminopeptidase
MRQSLPDRDDTTLARFVAMTAHPASADRLSHVRKAVADAGLGALLLTPGPDLRWLTGYEALPLERLTCLVLTADAEPFLLAPRLEVPAVEAAGVPGLGIDVVGWGETEDPYAVIAGRLGQVPSVGLANRKAEELADLFGAPTGAREPAGTVRP